MPVFMHALSSLALAKLQNKAYSFIDAWYWSYSFTHDGRENWFIIFCIVIRELKKWVPQKQPMQAGAILLTRTSLHRNPNRFAFASCALGNTNTPTGDGRKVEPAQRNASNSRKLRMTKSAVRNSRSLKSVARKEVHSPVSG